jgi:hypothetical protein
MVRHTWLSERALRCQEAHFLVQPRTEANESRNSHTVHILKGLDLYTRYQAHQDEPAVCQLGEDSIRSGPMSGVNN